MSASGDATLRLIKGGEVAAVNLDLIPNYANVFEGLKNQPHNTVDGVNYGVPHGRGPNLLAYNTGVVFVKFVGTHRAHDGIDADTVELE